MKAHVNMLKGKATSRASNQQSAFELKQRVVLALNKLADRDTYQIGVEELDKIVECLTPDGIAPFLSCILDTDSEQKIAVRKESIRLMGTMAIFHGGLVCPHLQKMVASIIKRLKDSDSVVRDACVETVGVLASKLSGFTIEADGIFLALVRPLFEALGEQNKHVQFGSALCLSCVIDIIHDPPPLVLQKMLARTVKLLKNPHFMAKPAVIELNRSIIMAGGATTHGSLKSALLSIQEALKSSDWATRKYACTALADIASCGMACLGSCRSSCISSLESCRFDKVKPVRDIALQALQLWKNISVPDTLEPSESGSSIRGPSYRDDYADVTSISNSTSRNNMVAKYRDQLSKRVPLSSRKTDGRTFVEKPQFSGSNDWQIDIAVPKNQKNSAVDNQNGESEGSSVSKRCERKISDTRSIKNIGLDYVNLDDKHECSSVSNILKENSKAATSHFEVVDDASFLKLTGTSRRLAADEASIEEQQLLTNVRDRRSMDSTVTESTSHSVHGCCAQTAKDMALIRKQLLEIENKQSCLMDMLKAFATSMMDSVSAAQSKVSHLEQVVNKLAQEAVHVERFSDISTKHMQNSPNLVSSRFSTCSSRPSVESHKQPMFLPPKQSVVLQHSSTVRNRPSALGKQNLDMWADVTPKLSKGCLSKGTTQEDQTRKNGLLGPMHPAEARLDNSQTNKNSHLWNTVKGYLYDGDIDSAYSEALHSRNELVLFELLDRTGPSLEYLSPKVASELLSSLASYLLEQRFVDSIIPWLQQLVDLSNIHGPTYLNLPAKAEREFLHAMKETAKLDVLSPSERKFIFELGNMLHQLWV